VTGIGRPNALDSLSPQERMNRSNAGACPPLRRVRARQRFARTPAQRLEGPASGSVVPTAENVAGPSRRSRYARRTSAGDMTRTLANSDNPCALHIGVQQQRCRAGGRGSSGQSEFPALIRRRRSRLRPTTCTGPCRFGAAIGAPTFSAGGNRSRILVVNCSRWCCTIAADRRRRRLPRASLGVEA
jgi:hypothetical protein